MRNYTFTLTGLVGIVCLLVGQFAFGQTTHACNHQVSHQDFIYLKDVVAHRTPNRNPSTCVAIQAHIFTQNNQTGGTPLFSLNYTLSCLNYYFAPVGVSFYWAAAPNYIANSDLYNYSLQNNSELDLVTSTTESIQAINIYFLNTISDATGAQFAGYAYTPNGNNAGNNRIFVTNNSLMASSHGTVVHEMGHYFGLLHTHNNTENGATSSLAENVTRTGTHANCQTSGDLICDTDADPRYNVGNFDQNNCHFTGPQTDIWGEAYHPMITNIMSYYPDVCGGLFTAGQYERMLQGLSDRLSYTAYSITGAQAVNEAPLDAYCTLNTEFSTIMVRWEYTQANLGFLIQRGTSPEGPFVDIIGGATNPNVTFFEDHNIEAGQQYYYRVRLANGACGQFSNVATVANTIINTTACVPTYDNQNGAAHIEKVEIADGSNKIMSKYSAWNPTNYSETNTPETILKSGKKYIVTIRTNTTTNTYAPQFVSIWADANANADFGDANELLLQTTQATDNRTMTVEVTIPDVTVQTIVRLRIRSSVQGIIMSPCQNYTAGETEDYLITVTPNTISTTTATAYLHAMQHGATANIEFGIINTNQTGSLILDRLTDDGSHIYLSTTTTTLSQDLQFEVTDLMPTNGQNTYRLYIVGSNGDTTELKSQTIDFSSDIQTIKTHFWPNPAVNVANIDFTSNIAAKTTILLMDNTGQTHYQTTTDAQKGINNLAIPTNGLATGSYTVIIAQKGQRIAQPLQIINE